MRIIVEHLGFSVKAATDIRAARAHNERRRVWHGTPIGYGDQLFTIVAFYC